MKMRKPPLKRFSSLYTGRKATLTDEDIQQLFSNDYVVEEKLDGTLTVREHKGMYLMLEDMRYTHSVFYDKLPARFILVDVCKKDGTRLSYYKRDFYSRVLGIPLPPVVTHIWRLTKPKYDDLEMFIKPRISGFGSEESEGFVIKSEVFMDLGGKHSRLDLTGVERYDKSRRNEIVG